MWDSLQIYNTNNTKLSVQVFSEFGAYKKAGFRLQDLNSIQREPEIVKLFRTIYIGGRKAIVVVDINE